MKTSIDFLLGELLENKLLALRYDKDDTMNEIVAKAKEMHKREIIEASIHTVQYNENLTLDAGLSIAKKYYQETFKKD
jgi:hypothetical protein